MVSASRIFDVLERLESAVAALSEKLSAHLHACATTHGGVDQRIALLAASVEQYARGHSKLGSEVDGAVSRIYALEKRTELAAAALPVERLQALENWMNAQEKATAAADAERRTERAVYGRLLPVIGALAGAGSVGYQIVQSMVGP